MWWLIILLAALLLLLGVILVRTLRFTPPAERIPEAQPSRWMEKKQPNTWQP